MHISVSTAGDYELPDEKPASGGLVQDYIHRVRFAIRYTQELHFLMWHNTSSLVIGAWFEMNIPKGAYRFP
jgi:hypothetical protein